MWVRTMISDGRSSTVRAPRSIASSSVVELDVLAEVLHVPAVGLVALAHVLAEGHLRLARELDLVVVVEDDEPAEPEVPGQRAGLRGHALLHVAVARDRVRVVIDDLVPAG